MDIPRKPLWPKVLATVVVMVVIYPLSYGPIGWLCERPNCPQWFQEAAVYFYYPLLWLTSLMPQSIQNAWDYYVFFFFVP